MAASPVNAAQKRAVHDKLHAICNTADSKLESTVAKTYEAGAELNAFHPVDQQSGSTAIAAALWKPLRESLPDVERRDLIVAASDYDDRQFVACMGHYQGNFVSDFHGIPATHGVVMLRYGEIHEIKGERIARSFVIVDLLDLMRQAGCWPTAPSLGAEETWPSPARPVGVRPDTVDPVRGAEALQPVINMHKALLSFDGKTLESMDHARYWTPDFLWYGPSGIGTTRGLAGFQAHHQIPFLRAFPDRKGGKHIAKIADGDFVVTGGWPSVVATHTGPDWLGLGPTGRAVNMRVMDFYRIDGELIAENWVPIDIIDILRQLGVDALGRMRHRTGEPRLLL